MITSLKIPVYLGGGTLSAVVLSSLMGAGSTDDNTPAFLTGNNIDDSEPALILEDSDIEYRTGVQPVYFREPNDAARSRVATAGDELVTELRGLRSVPVEYERYNATVRVLDGRYSCTGSIVNMDGYSPTEEGVLISTAAHCFLNERTPTADDLDTGRIQVRGVFQDQNGMEAEFTLSNAASLWIHPDYEYVEDDVSHSRNNEDLALIFFKNVTLPEEIRPYRQAVFESSVITPVDLSIRNVITAGYSRDVFGLSVDECEITFASNILENDCTHTPGSSGGPTFPFNNPYETIAVTALYHTRGGEAYQNTLNFFDHDALSTVPFLERHPDIPVETLCARVDTEDGLNLRTGPGTDYRRNGPLLSGENGGEELYVDLDDAFHFLTDDSLGRQWAFVTTQDGRQGYTAIIGEDGPNTTDFEPCG